MGPDAPLLSKPVQGQHPEIKPESSKTPQRSKLQVLLTTATAATAKGAKLTETWKKRAGREMPSKDAKSS